MQRAARERIPEPARKADERRPRPALAGALALLPYAWGLGQWYAGERGRAALMHFAQLAVLAATCYGLPRYGIWVAALPLLAAVASVFDAVRVARRAPAFQAPLRQRAVIATAFWIATNVVVNAEVQLLWDHVADVSIVQSVDMAPALLPGDWVVGDLRAYRSAEPSPGDLVLVREPGAEPDSRPSVSRVVARGGDLVELRAQLLYVNGERITGGRPVPYSLPDGDRTSVEEELGARHFRVLRDDRELVFRRVSRFEVEPDTYFVLGDNRDVSRDSRAYGALPRASIVGRATYRILARDPVERHMRWGQIGPLP